MKTEASIFRFHSLIRRAKIEFFTLLSKSQTPLFCLINATIAFQNATPEISLTPCCKSERGVLTALCKKSDVGMAPKESHTKKMMVNNAYCGHEMRVLGME